MKTLLPEQVWLSLVPVDMRLGIDGLSRQIPAVLGKSPCDGSAYAFCNKRGNRIKLLIWDGTGVWLSQRRLHRVGYFLRNYAELAVQRFKRIFGNTLKARALPKQKTEARIAAFALNRMTQLGMPISIKIT